MTRGQVATRVPIREKKAALGQLIHVGALMSNLCFNIAQRGECDTDVIVRAGELRLEWDAARTEWNRVRGNS